MIKKWQNKKIRTEKNEMEVQKYDDDTYILWDFESNQQRTNVFTRYN